MALMLQDIDYKPQNSHFDFIESLKDHCLVTILDSKSPERVP